MDARGVIEVMVIGLWVFLPAMLPNSAAVIFGGGTKIDFGKSWKGKRIFGDGKTWRGLFGGAFAGIVLGLILMGISHSFDPTNHWGFGSLSQGMVLITTLAFGAILGDLIGAFIKRRMGLNRGAKAPFLDQYDFVLGAFLLTALFNPGWVFGTYFAGWNLLALLFLLFIMFGLHRIANIIGYKMGLKDEPW